MSLTWTDIADIATVLAAIVAAIGILFAYRELTRNTRVHRGQFLLDATARYFTDVAMRGLYYDIDYYRFKLNFDDGSPKTVQRGEGQPKPFFVQRRGTLT